MGFLDKLKFNTNDFGDDTDTEDGDYGYNYAEEVPAERPAAREPAREPAKGMMLNSNNSGSLELKVVRPKEFDTVPQIADHLLSRRTVVLNLEETNKETAKRVVDFLSGVAYSIDGSIKKVASNTYVITPANVDVSGDPMRRAKEEKREEYDED